MSGSFDTSYHRRECTVTETCVLSAGDSNPGPHACAASIVQIEPFPHPITFVVSLKRHELIENKVWKLYCTQAWCRQAGVAMEKFLGGALNVMVGLDPVSFQLTGFLKVRNQPNLVLHSQY